MYLKRLELCGFKSFADKTRLEFEPGISGIIGPNGCGKSNVSDAIRWCLGEQSARSMRSSQMLDVIFGGSQSRQTTGMAEVALTFDNSQNILPIDYSEVTISRRLFRSGESEYFLNKAQCRLKDIRDLFLDTGIGSEGYAVIEQGKVEFLLSAKPDERREMFEEAAGVSRYKVRREETLRKLEKVEIDMNRVNDMLSLLKEQITALDVAARKARLFQKHKEDLKRQEIAYMVNQISIAFSEIERIKKELDPKNMEFEVLNTNMDQFDAELSQLRFDQVEKDEQYVKIQDDFSKIKSEISMTDERIYAASGRESELEERKVNLHSEIESDSVRINTSEIELQQVKTLWIELTERVKVLEHDYKEKEVQLQDIRTKLDEKLRNENDLKSNLVNLISERSSLNNEQNRLSSLQTHLNAEMISVEKALNRLNEQKTPLQEIATKREHEITLFKENISFLTSREENEKITIATLEQKLNEYHEKQSLLKEKIVYLQSKSQTLKEWESKDPIRTAINSVLSLNLPGIKGTISSQIRIDDGVENIVAAALGDKLSYVLADTEATAREALNYLKVNGLGRLTFLILELIPEITSTQLTDISDNSKPLIFLMHYEEWMDKPVRYICNESKVSDYYVYGRATIQGGSEITFEKPIFIEEHINKIAEEISFAKQELEKVTTEERVFNEQYISALETRKEIELELQKTSVQIELTEKQLDTQKQELDYIDKEILLNKSDIDTKLLEIDETSIKLNVIEESLARIVIDERKLNESLVQVENEILKLREEENTLIPLLTESKVAWATQNNEISGREREEQKLHETIDSLTQYLEQAQCELQSIEIKINEQRTNQENESFKLKQLHAQMEQKNIQVQAVLSDRQSFIRQIEEKNTILHNLRQQVEVIKQDIHNTQIEQRSFELQKQNKEQRLSEEYSLSFEDAKNEYSNIEIDEEEISRLKRRIDSMGAVNLAAPEEYANLEERYNFLLTQQQDLFKAKEDLHNVISKINHTTKESFRVTFDKVRENFCNIYRQLFEGGEADLILTDESNMLESGVDIMAQPPGKKLQNIALLSGGEKALTAIALLFAFFMVKPSPFCILDEVDAPLDDANIGRYINMVKSFASKSQFLVITHSKKTMEMADVLYGVTMEELGVSKIISVRLNNENLAASA